MSRRQIFCAFILLALLMLSSFINFSSSLSAETTQNSAVLNSYPQGAKLGYESPPGSTLSSSVGSFLASFGNGATSLGHALFTSIDSLLQNNPQTISPTPNAVIATITTPTVGQYGFLQSAAYDSWNKELYFGGTGCGLCGANGDVTAINTTSDTVSAEIGLQSGDAMPTGIAYDPGNHGIYVTAAFNAALSGVRFEVDVINDTTNSVVTTIPTGFSPRGIAFDPLNSEMFVASPDGTVTVINTTTNTVENTITLPILSNNFGTKIYPSANTVVYDSSNGLVYVGDLSAYVLDLSNFVFNVYAINPKTSAVVSTLQVPTASNWRGATSMIYNPQNGDVYVADLSNAISLIGPSSSIVGEIDLDQILTMTYDGANGLVYAVSDTNGFAFPTSGTFPEFGPTVYALDPQSGIRATISSSSLGFGNVLIASDPRTGNVYTVNEVGPDCIISNVNCGEGYIAVIFTGNPVALSLDPSTSDVHIGSTTSLTATVTTATIVGVTLSATGLPQGATVSWTTNPIIGLPSGVEDSLDISTSLTTKPGTYIVTINATTDYGSTALQNYTLLVHGFKVQFVEQGLPSGTFWSASLEASPCTSPCKGIQNGNSTGNTIEFDNLGAGSYSWSVLAPINAGSGVEFSPALSNGVIFVEGDTQQAITYNEEYSVTFSANPQGSGTIQPSGTSSFFQAGSSVSISASNSSGYAFYSWSASQYLALLNPSSASTKMTVNGPGSLVANFYPTVKLTANSTTVETIQGSSIVVGVVVSGGAQLISMRSAGYPSGATPTWSQIGFTDSPAGFPDSLRIATSSSTPVGSYAITLYADGLNGQVSSTLFNFTVFAPSSADTVSINSPHGTVLLSTASGQFANITNVAQSAVPPGQPGGVSFPFGIFSWSITGLSVGQSVSVTMKLAFNVPSSAQYWKFLGGKWTNETSLLSGNNGGNTLALTITDGGSGDADGSANGQISDPGGVALRLVTSPGSANTITGEIGVGSLQGIPGSPPGAFAFDSTNGYLYVIPSLPQEANGFLSSTASVYVINPATQAVIASIPNIEDGNLFGTQMTFDSTNGEIYIASSQCQSCFTSVVYAINTVSNSVAQTITPSTSPLLAYDPSAIGFDPVNGYVYVGGYSSSGASAVVSVIDGSTNNVIDSISLGSTSNIPVAFAFDSSTGNIYAALANSSVVIINGATNTLTSHVSGVQCCSLPVGVAFDPSNANIYLAQEGSDNVSIISTATNSVAAFTIVNIFPSAVSFDSFNGNIYVASTSGVAVIDGSSNKLVASLSFDTYTVYIFALASNPTNGDVYALSHLGSIYVISGTTNTLAGSLGVGNYPTALTFDSLNGDIYVASLQSDSVYVINGATNSVIANVTVPNAPYALAFDPLDGDVYVASQGGISVINGATNAVIGTPFTFPSNSGISSSSNSMAFDPANGDIYFGYLSVPSPTSVSTVIVVIDGTTNKIVSTTSYPGFSLISMVLDSSNGDIYATASCPAPGCSGVVPVVNTLVKVISTATNTVVASVRVGDSPDGLAFDPANGDIYVANSGDSYLSVIDGATNTVVANATILCSGNPCGYGFGHHPTSATFDSSNGDIYVADADGSVAVIDGGSNTEIALLQPGIVAETAIVFDATNGNIYVSGGFDPYVCGFACSYFTSGSGFVAVISTTGTSPLLSPVKYPVSFLQTGAGVNPTVMYTLSNGTSGIGVAPFTIYVDAFPQVSLSYTYEAIVSGTAGVQYVLTSTTPASPQDVNGPLQITGTYKTQYLVTFSQAGLDSTAQGTVVVVNGSPLQLGALTFSEYVDSGTTINFQYSNAISSSNAGERFMLGGILEAASDSSVQVNGPTAIVADYTTQYQVTFESSPLAGGSTSPPSGAQWYDAGSVLNINAISQPGYALSTWSTTNPSGISISAPALSATELTIYGSGIVTANYVPSLALSLNPVEIGVIAGGSTSTTATISGAPQTVTMSVSGLPLYSSASFATSTITESGNSPSTNDMLTISTSTSTPSGTYSVTVTATGADGLTASQNFTLLVSSTGYDLTFSESGLQAGVTWAVTLDGVQYSSSSSSLTVSNVVPGLHEWAAEDPVPGSSGVLYEPSPSRGAVELTSSAQVTLAYSTEYQVSFETQGLDSSALPSAFAVAGLPGIATPFPATLPHSFYVSSGTVLSFSYSGVIQSSNAGERFALSSISGNTSDSSVQVNAPTVIMADYTPQYQVTFASNSSTAGSTSPSTGTQWYDAGSTISISATPASGYAFLGWTSSSATQLSIANPSNSNTYATIKGPGTITANFVHSQFEVTFTESGLPTGTLWSVTFAGDTLTSSSNIITFQNVQQGSFYWNASNPIYGSISGIRYMSSESSGTLSVQQAQTNQAVAYMTQYFVSLLASPQGAGSTNPSGSSWYDSGSSVTISASSAPGYEFETWSTSNPSGILISSSQAIPIPGGESTVATINGPGMITANFGKLPLGVGSVGVLTDSSLCAFDTNSTLAGQQFNLVFAGDSAGSYGLSSSNPGQFYYNVFYVGTPGTQVSLQITIPYPFITQGSVPAHEYGSVSLSEGCFEPSDQLGGFTVSGTNTKTPSGALSISVADYNPEKFGSVVTITVSGVVPSTGLVYVAVHLSYGLKGTSGYLPDANDDAVSSITIANYYPYIFSVSGGAWGSGGTSYNQNLFEKTSGQACEHQELDQMVFACSQNDGHQESKRQFLSDQGHSFYSVSGLHRLSEADRFFINNLVNQSADSNYKSKQSRCEMPLH